jgi:hypothetical protein
MNLVDEEHPALGKIGEQTGKITGSFDDRTRGRYDLDTEFFRENMSERGFPETGGSTKESVVECIATLTCCLKKDSETLFHLGLADELVQARGT